MNKKAWKWLGIGSIAGILTILSILRGFWVEYKESSSTIKMFLRQQQISNNDERTIFVCFNDTLQKLSGISVTPIYDNSSEYPIKGFDLRYNIEFADGNSPMPNGFFERVKISDNNYEYKYKENVLPQFSQTYEPFQFSDLTLTNSRYIIRSKASYSGLPEQFIYTVRLWLFMVPKRSNQSLEDWKLSCKDAIYRSQAKPNLFDVYYCCDGQLYNEFGKDFGSVDTGIASSNNKSVPLNNKPKTDIYNNVERSNDITNNIESVPKKTIENKSFTDNNSSEIKLSNKDLQYTSFRTQIEDNICYLIVNANQVLKEAEEYLLVYRTKGNSIYEVVKFEGNNTTEAKVKLYNKVQVVYVGAPIEDNSLKDELIIRKTDDGRATIEGKSKKVVGYIFSYKYKGSKIERLTGIASTNYKRTVPVDDISSIDIEKTFSWKDGDNNKEKEPWWKEMLFFLGMFLSLTMGFMFCHIGKEDSSSKKERIIWWSLGIVLILIGLYISGVR